MNLQVAQVPDRLHTINTVSNVAEAQNTKMLTVLCLAVCLGNEPDPHRIAMLIWARSVQHEQELSTPMDMRMGDL